MSFTADKQTLNDLNLTNRYKADSIFNLFKRTRTKGGEKWLEQLFNQPLSDPAAIRQRSLVFSFFQDKALVFPFNAEDIGLLENYLGGQAAGNLFTGAIGNLRKQVLAAALHDEQYAFLRTGIRTTITVLQSFSRFIERLDLSAGHPYEDLPFLIGFIKDPQMQWLSAANTDNLSVLRLTRYDHLLRHRMRAALEQLLQVIFRLDVYIAVGAVASEGGFCYATPLPRTHNQVHIEDMRHPALKKAVANSLSYRHDSNVLFLTGANMAGKSTLMKTFGISLYLAHMGFPVAARRMEFSVKDGMYSSINVADNLHLGYSHFYAEVLRVKKVAEAVSNGQDMIVIFDELFKGTNVKDAFDATLAVTAAFSQYRNCFFMISTHIIEVGESLQRTHNNIQFRYMPTLMNGTIPTYPYTLTEGITTDRQGMIIIENEGILDILQA